MAILRNSPDADDPISYVASAAFLCCVSMVVVGLFGFYAKIKVASKRSKDEDVPVVCISGAYRLKRDDFFETGNLPGPPKKITPAMVTLPLNNSSMKPSKSTNDLREPEFRPVMLNKSTPDVSMDPRGASNHSAEVELRNPKPQKSEDKDKNKIDKKLEKKRQDEQKAREKAAQDLAKKQAKEKLKQEKEQAKLAKANKKTKTKAPKAPPLPLSPPPQTPVAPTVINPPPRQPLAQTNSLQSNINRSSGPPPYSELPENKPPQASTSNVSFGKPIDNTPSSWDMVSQHRQQMSRPTSTIGGARKQMVMDLQYNFNKNSSNDKDNSDA